MSKYRIVIELVNKNTRVYIPQRKGLLSWEPIHYQPLLNESEALEAIEDCKYQHD